jgi:hypothetical protein
VESLRQKVEELAAELKELKNPDYSLALTPINSEPSEFSELDQSLIARHQNLKDFFIQYTKAQSLESELEENIDYAAEELVRQDDEILKLKGENSKLKSTN